MKKLTKVLLLSASLFLASCGGEKPKPSETPSKEPDRSIPAPDSSEEAPKSSSEEAPKSSSEEAPKSSSTPAPSSSSEAEAATVTFDGIDMITESNKAMIKITGKMEGLAEANRKMALSITHAASEGIDDGTGGYILGSETPAAADYKYAPTVAADGTFTLKVDVSAVPFTPGAYKVFAGPQGHYVDVTNTLTGNSSENNQFGGGKAKTSTQRLYFRADIKLLMADQLPPVALTEALIEEGTGEDAGKVFILIGGELSISAADFEAKDPFMQFQVVGGSWTTTRMDTQEGVVSCIVRENKGYVKVDITALGENNYNTHLNVDAKTQADCKMENNLNTKNKPVVIGNKAYSVYCNTAGTDQAEFWGNLALIITHAHNGTRGEAVGDMYPVTCTCSSTIYELDHNDQKMKADKTWNITGVTAGEYEIYLKGHASTGNGSKAFTGNTTNGAISRYGFKVGEGETEEILDNASQKDFGWNEGDSSASTWTLRSVSKIMIAEGSTAFTMVWTGSGYSSFIAGVRLVRIGNYGTPASKLSTDTTKIEAENAHIKENMGEAAVDAEASNGSAMTGLTQSGNWWSPTVGKLGFKVKALAALNVKVKIAYKSANAADKGAFDLYIDGVKNAGLGAASEAWTTVESEAIALTLGEHTITLQGISNVSADIDYIEVIKQAA